MRRVIALISVILIVSVFSCEVLKPKDGKLTISISSFTDGEGGSAIVVLSEGATMIGGNNAPIVGGAASIPVLDLTMQPWVGTGGKTYIVVILVNMNDGSPNEVGVDYKLNGDAKFVSINGDTTLSLTGSDFILQ